MTSEHPKSVGVVLLLLLALALPAAGPTALTHSPLWAASPTTTEVADGPAEAQEVPASVVAELDEWMEAALGWVAGVLRDNPPGSGGEGIRRLALETLDDPLHIQSAPDRQPVGDFFRSMVEQAVTEIEQEPVVRGAVVWKLYNHGFVVRTPEHAYAFDLIPGAMKASLSEEQIARLVNVIEVLFISHSHGDHVSLQFAEKMRALGKPVVIPPDLWLEGDAATGMTRLSGGANRLLSGLSVRVFPGHQEDMPNNVYLVTADGLSVMHTGDQSNWEDFERWIDGVSAEARVDILLPNCWTPDLPRMIRGVDPGVVITGHENELWHPVYQRESYGKSYGHLRGVTHNHVLMTWGERFHYLGDEHVADLGDEHVADLGDEHVADLGDEHVADLGDEHVADLGDEYVADLGDEHVADLGDEHLSAPWGGGCERTVGVRYEV